MPQPTAPGTDSPRGQGACRPSAPPATEGQGGTAVLVRARGNILLMAAFYVCATALSLVYNLWRVQGEHEALALSTGRSFFQEVVVTRRWNALHGGVYVSVTPTTQPNPYLEDPKRDILTTDGLRLTKLNPAYMTRLISEVMRQEQGTQFRVTSLRPIRPENAPDAWERSALEVLESGAPEHFSVVDTGEGSLFRYIAPLKTEESCLACHAKQGYKLGDIRGGISVSIPYAPYRAALLGHYRTTTTAHALFLLLGLGFVGVLGRSLLARIRELQESAQRVRKLEGLLPICSGCKKIRTAGADPREQSSWEPIERYIQDRTDANFTHGLCPECAKKYFGRYAAG